MSETERPVYDAALSLPAVSRAELAELLWASLPDEPLEDVLPADIKDTWCREAKRRMAEVDDGHVDLIPGEEVMARLRQRAEG